MATEKVTVYGLPIVAARKVNYSRSIRRYVELYSPRAGGR
ncbi:MAG: DUF3418 domain-containing protein [Escherichia coli]